MLFMFFTINNPFHVLNRLLLSVIDYNILLSENVYPTAIHPSMKRHKFDLVKLTRAEKF